MKIAIDIDDTISNTKQNNIDILRKYNYKENCRKDFEIKTFDQFIEKHKDEILNTMKPIDNASEVINRMYEENEIYIVSARNINGYVPWKETVEFFCNYNIPFDRMYLDCQEKGLLCNQLGIDLIIDDSEYHLRECGLYGIKTIKFGKSNNYISFDNWLDLEKYIKEVTNGEDYRWQKKRR